MCEGFKFAYIHFRATLSMLGKQMWRAGRVAIAAGGHSGRLGAISGCEHGPRRRPVGRTQYVHGWARKTQDMHNKRPNAIMVSDSYAIAFSFSRNPVFSLYAISVGHARPVKSLFPFSCNFGWSSKLVFFAFCIFG